MILFGWKKRVALSMCFFLFLGSVSYLLGTIESPQKKRNTPFRSFLANSSYLKIVDKPFKVSLSRRMELKRGNLEINRKNFVERLKEEIKRKIIFRFKEINSDLVINLRDIEGYFAYKWIKENSLKVVVKFSLKILNRYDWYYDQFSVYLWV